MISETLAGTISYFITLIIELSILFIGISFLVGLIREFVPEEKIKSSLEGKKRGVGNIIGAGFGSLTPFCSCSTIPVLAGLLGMGIPVGISFSFLLASPLLNPVVIALIVALLGWKLTIIYGILTFSMAVIVGVVIDFYDLSDQIKTVAIVGDEDEDEKSHEPKARAKRAGRFSIELFRDLFPYLLIGSAIGAVIHGYVPEEFLATYAGADNPLAIPLAAFIGVPMYIRAATIIPIGSALAAKGMGIGAVIALIIGGAGASIPAVSLLNSLFKKKLLGIFIASIFTIAIVLGFIFTIILA